MEPPKTKINYVFNVRIAALNEEFYQKWVSGVGPDAVFEPVSKGWFMLLEGSKEAIHLGFEEPHFKTGDMIKVTFERIGK